MIKDCSPLSIFQGREDDVPLIALVFLLIAALLHTGWNFALKNAKYKPVFIWLALCAGSVCSLVFLISGSALPARVWPYAVSSAIVEVLYYVALTRAYDYEDFSLIYPVARGAAPALLVLWTTLFLNEPPRSGGVAGLGLIIIGLMIVSGGATIFRLGWTSLSVKGVLAALAAACCISIYSAIDGAAVRFASPLPYTVLILALTSLLLAPFIVAHHGTRVVRDELRHNWWRIVLVGVGVITAYGIVLYVYTFTRISYAGAVREGSVVFAALAGWLFLGERFGALRTAGALLIFVGIIVIALWG